MDTEINEARPLKVLIVGAGIGGLTAAVGLRQQGHQVTLFERSELAQEVGAALHLAPNCNRILHRLGIDAETVGANKMNGFTEYDDRGNLQRDMDLRDASKKWDHPWLLCHRVQLHNELKRVATSDIGDGSPATLKLGCRVAAVDGDKACVTLENGTEFQGDVVLGADGLSSASRKALDPNARPFGSGKSAFRFMIPRQRILDNPLTRSLANRDGYMVLFFGPDRSIVLYPCSDNTAMNFGAIHPNELSASQKDKGWDQMGAKETLLDIYKDFDPRARAVLEMTDKSNLKLWTLMDMDQLPHWVNGKLALLGDAAHPFLPYQGQGGAMAIEDAASICAVLPRGTPVNEIKDRLALYERVRMGRAHKIQSGTRLAGQDSDHGKQKKFNLMQFLHYNIDHDEWQNSVSELNKWLNRAVCRQDSRWRVEGQICN